MATINNMQHRPLANTHDAAPVVKSTATKKSEAVNKVEIQTLPKTQPTAKQSTDSVKLAAPKLDLINASQLLSTATQMMDCIALLVKAQQQVRQSNDAVATNQATAAAESQKKQAQEMDKNSDWQLALSIVSGVLNFGMTALSAISAFKANKTQQQKNTLQQSINERTELVKTKTSQLKDKTLSVKQKDNLKVEIAKLKDLNKADNLQLKTLNDASAASQKWFDLANSALQQGSSLVDKFSGAKEIKTQQTVTQEQVKENSAQQVQQKSRNETDYLNGLSTKLNQLMIQLSQGQSQALRAATPAA
ncbi:type III secretion system translocon subunit SctB [Arsenophonus sp. aPb]|uniref:type III secretion system translocon subunit SctB n=1 Tax=Arsenophonus sp. aPb TaxID=3041619 RepID=UPI002468A6DA|nr:type III secretion system translocon subunit SctB [Arsenophonus sp. aPb]WGL97570.1 type III secretion system translocon subunit SctB [Arsenophonus sp. aPb]